MTLIMTPTLTQVMFGLLPFNANDADDVVDERGRKWMLEFSHPVTGRTLKEYPVNSPKRGSNSPEAMEPYTSYATLEVRMCMCMFMHMGICSMLERSKRPRTSIAASWQVLIDEGVYYKAHGGRTGPIEMVTKLVGGVPKCVGIVNVPVDEPEALPRRNGRVPREEAQR